MFIGHSLQLELFKRVIKRERLSHAYIFEGLAGIGKKLFAYNLSKSLLCERGSYFTECSCSSCAKLNAGAHPDFYSFSGAELNMENAKAMTESVSMTPLMGKWKVLILDRAEVFSSSQISAGNALLKTLEEPGENTVFFMITDRYDQILPTIRSRASLVKFSPLSVPEIRQIITQVRPEVKFVDKAALLSNGSVEKTLRIIDSSAPDILAMIESSDFTSFIKTVMAEKDSDNIKLMISFIYKEALNRYKRTGVYDVCHLGYYLLDILKRFNYNINLDLLKADFVSKVTEVFSVTR